VAPVSWLIAHDVEEGRRELNFSTWQAYSAADKRKKLRKTAEEVKDLEMPPWYYLSMHPEALLDQEARILIGTWTAGEVAALAAVSAEPRR
jgi:hypothetical protein